jgi:hypothetical protein
LNNDYIAKKLIMSKNLTTEQLKKRRKTNLTIIIITLILLAVLGHFVSGDDKDTRPAKNNLIDNSVKSLDTVKAIENNDAWQYQTTTDEMEGSTSKFAVIQAETSISFPFPYGDSNFFITIRKKKNNTDIMLSCSSCQFLAGIIDEKKYRVKFDDQPPFSVSITGTSDGDTKTVFLSSENILIDKLKKAKSFIIEPEFYQEGRKTITFKVAGLKW